MTNSCSNCGVLHDSDDTLCSYCSICVATAFASLVLRLVVRASRSDMAECTVSGMAESHDSKRAAAYSVALAKLDARKRAAAQIRLQSPQGSPALQPSDAGSFVDSGLVRLATDEG